MRLSTHFDSSEFACKCGCGRAAVAPALVAALEQLRVKIGQPVHITNGRRCPAHNKQVGGSPNSQHLLGCAADISVVGRTGDDLYLAARAIPLLRGFGVAAGWIHVDVRSSGDLSRWRYDSKGRVTAWPEGSL